jgi:integrase
MAGKHRGKQVETPEGLRVFGKAANGDGSVYRQADGRWCATWWVAGEKRPRKATGKTRQQAIDRREKRRMSSGLDRDGLGTVGALAEWWLYNVQKPAVRASSWAKSEDRVRRIKATLGDLPVLELDYRRVTEWQATLGETLAPRTVRLHRQTLAQVVDEAVKMGALIGNPVRAVDPPKVTDADGIALELHEIRALVDAVADHRLGAAVALLFMQGWRVSEVLGLAWQDVDIEERIAEIRRGSVYVDGHGQRLGPPKTEGARGEHWLLPTVVELLVRHRELQEQERAVAPFWETITYEGQELHMVFTTPTGGLVLRQTVAKVVRQGAKTAGVAGSLGTHDGRRSVITALWSEGHEPLEDIARYVGHANTATTAGYVKRRGRRPKAVAERAADLLEGRSGEVRNQVSEAGSNPESNDLGSPGRPTKPTGRKRTSRRSPTDGSERS